MTTPSEPEFAVAERGFVRDQVVLATIRNGLRALVNPETGAPFTEDEIQRATQPRGRLWSRAEAIDLYAQAEQRSAIYLADQLQIDRANTAFLDEYHGREAGEPRLEPTGGSGVVNVPAVAGTIIVGSTTLPDPTAYQARDAAGKLYQVFTTVITPGSGVAPVTLASLSPGADTNLQGNTKLTWVTKDPNMAPEATVAADFSGGTDLETDGEYARRLLDEKSAKQAAGNDAHMRAWARRASNAVEDAYIYPCALHAGSVIIAVTQKRGASLGPAGRFPAASTMAAVTSLLVPPGSPVVPTPPHVVVTAPVLQDVDAVVTLRMARGSSAGFTDATPFPAIHATTPDVAVINSPTDLVLRCLGDSTLPGLAALSTAVGADAPAIMLWHSDTSSFERLSVASIEDLGSSFFRVLLTGPPNPVAQVGEFVCPDVGRKDAISASAVQYFDERGPGDLFDVDADPRGVRCVRFPDPLQTKPAEVGAALATRIADALPGSASDAVLDSISDTVPDYPTDPNDGPRMLVLRRLGVYFA